MEFRVTAPLIALVGPTAVGKTALAIALAHRLDGEIISADSRQVYRRMEIGTAKPSAAECAAAPHHLIDLCEPDEAFSLARYQDLALASIAEVVARGHLPLLVGGTGQYLAAVLEGWQIPRVAPQPALRAELLAEAEHDGGAQLYERLAAVDPMAALQIGPTNVRRIIRALEVYLVTGEPISTQQTRQPPPYQIRTIWLTRPRQELYARADARVDAMLEAGLVEEVEALVAAGYGWHLPAMSSLGYIQFKPYLEGEADLQACIERLKYDTHSFIRRQGAWFRRLPQLEQWTPGHPEWVG
ncbi:tRNA (adenosine(37)-N6)-dimethylallyltransferase MiaA [Candidatus Chloroploca sp. M-50]|uniref:tRNA dimethylallyltransferase n=1 Tax=Candidatus Chloroploca mongolica TaxID=2528176 RepID=A0ABS4D6U1_9CHLR|nr:tRNA (adenosine(37)-N6)-dimethylallyltransferase MiaA [Candidatus Chloroploca mongolica]MBP1465150.1 tRNA (adenosine(37)-N6)-dimethylallyltransferase MiaA [Candidatus Chloroploca mongolica]